MQTWTRVIPLGLALGLSLTGCGDDGSGNDSGNDSGSADDTGTSGGDCVAEGDFPAAGESGCMPAATDYQPVTNAEGDGWPACSTDDGTYHLVDTTPSSIARVEAYEQVMELLRADELTPQSFTDARTIYSADEGLESRLVRREDLHYPEIPMADWDPGVDPDKQCTVEANVMKYPERCAGPGRISPIVLEAFEAGQTGEGEPRVHAARIEAAFLWFMHLSVYKEANTCLIAPKDCDSSWAYYTGGFDRSGGIGLSAEIRALSDLTHQRIWDGFSAARCWRELYPIEDHPTLDDVDATGQELLSNAYDQLDDALWYGWARLVRDHLEQQAGTCGVDAAANWAFLQIVGPVLSEEAERIDATAAAPLTALWQSDAPTVEDLQGAVMTIDSIFACP